MGFGYLNETRWKNIEYSKSFAPVPKENDTNDTRLIGVLCHWYHVKIDKSLDFCIMKVQGYTEITKYQSTIRPPERRNGKMYIPDAVFKKIKKFI